MDGLFNALTYLLVGVSGVVLVIILCSAVALEIHWQGDAGCIHLGDD